MYDTLTPTKLQDSDLTYTKYSGRTRDHSNDSTEQYLIKVFLNLFLNCFKAMLPISSDKMIISHWTRWSKIPRSHRFSIPKFRKRKTLGMRLCFSI